MHIFWTLLEQSTNTWNSNYLKKSRDKILKDKNKMKQNGRNNPAFTCTLPHTDDENMRIIKRDDGGKSSLVGLSKTHSVKIHEN
jgi:hypothetical protein